MPRDPQTLVIADDLGKSQKTKSFSLPNRYFEREILFVSLIGFSCFFLLSIISFSPLDSSPISSVVPQVAPQNLGGSIGSFLAALSMYFFGIFSYALPIPFIATGLFLILNNPKPFAPSRLLGWLIGTLVITTFLSIYLSKTFISGYLFLSGGVIGATLSHFLLLFAGSSGIWIVLGVLFFCSLSLIIQNSVLVVLYNCMRKFEIPSFKLSRCFLSNLTFKIMSDKLDSKLERSKISQKDFSILKTTPCPTNESTLTHDKDHSNLNTHEDRKAYLATSLFSDNGYKPPALSILRKNAVGTENTAFKKEEFQATAAVLSKTLSDFCIDGNIVGYQPGPSVTVFEFQPHAGIKSSKILSLADDLALALKVDSIFINPVRGKHALGIQVPNTKRESVLLGDIVSHEAFQKSPSPLTFAMGKSISGQPVFADLAVMPHLLVAGATGSGKSVAVNSLLSSIILKASPDLVKMILVDPKMLELSVYEGIPHLLMPVITEPYRASLALKWAAKEMERRYKLMQLASVRHISGFNEYWERCSLQEREELGKNADDEEPIGKLPYIILVIDELADLMLTAPKDVESSIQRLAQKARASGIHLVFATQRPSVDVITGVIKANLPCRIAFQVVSRHDSRTILDQIGAEKLLGRGDMLFQLPGVSKLERLQGAFISDEEVLNIVAAVKATSHAKYDQTIISWINDELTKSQSILSSDADEESDTEQDPKYGEAIEIARGQGAISASYLQRQLKIGYNRAARMVEYMEAKGLVDKADGVKPRKWLGSGQR